MFENMVAKRMHLLHTESAFAVFARAKALEAQGRDIIHLELGQPDFKTPQNIIDAANHAMNNGYTGYAPAPGYPEARQAIADYALRHKGVKATKEEVIIVPGGKPIMFYTMQMLVDPGDEVIYPNPSFPIYESCIRYAGGLPVPLRLTAENDFRLNIEEFKELITPKTKMVIINNTSNPTGGVFTREDILAMAEILKEHPDIFILSDEIYDRLIFDGEVFSIASIPEFKDRTIILDGFSKTYAMTGWRLGFGIMHSEFVRHMEMLMVNTNSCTASFSQMAAIEALNGPQYAVDEMRVAFVERRDYLVGALNAIDGIKCCLPQGAFYAFPDISSFGLPDKEFAIRLLDEFGVAAAWGTAFGEFGKGYIRLSYANSLDNIKIAVERLKKFTRTL